MVYYRVKSLNINNSYVVYINYVSMGPTQNLPVFYIKIKKTNNKLMTDILREGVLKLIEGVLNETKYTKYQCIHDNSIVDRN